jgi:hypothetical protein
MAERLVKYLLVTYFEEHPDVNAPNGVGLRERLAWQGQTVDFTREEDEARLDELGALYTPEEAKEIEDGIYKGPEAQSIYDALGQQPATEEGSSGPAELPAGGIAEMSVDEVAELINPPAFDKEGKRLTVDETIALAGDDVESIEKVIDAENLATNNEPRQGVLNALEAKLAAAAQG